MKFTCERCGKKYATADNPTPGRVYKIKCKACGHLIVVKASAAPASEAAPARPPETASAHAPGPGPAPALDASLHSAATPIADLAPAGSVASAPSSAGTASIILEIGTPEPTDIPDNGASRVPSFEMPAEASAATLRGQHALEHTPTRGEPGYVDLFSDVSGIQELPQKPSDDPFMAAARASLPDGYGSGSSPVPDPFADLRDDISATSEPEPPPRPPPAIPKMPVIPRPKHQERSNLPILLIGAGVAVLVGILAFVLLSNGKKSATTPTPTPAPVATTAPPPRAPPVAAPAPPQVEPPIAQPEPPVAAPAPPAPARSEDAERRARAEQKRKEREEAQAREEKARAEREARDRDAKARAKAEREAKAQAERDAKAQAKAEREARDREAREAKARSEQEAREARARAAAEAKERERAARQAAAAEDASGDAEGGLTQAQIEGVLRSTKPAFDSCIKDARGGGVPLDGRRVMLRLNIQSTGTVTYPTLDDVTLNATDLGTCLKGAARLMVFPKFNGDTMHVEVPLVMR